MSQNRKKVRWAAAAERGQKIANAIKLFGPHTPDLVQTFAVTPAVIQHRSLDHNDDAGN